MAWLKAESDHVLIQEFAKFNSIWFKELGQFFSDVLVERNPDLANSAAVNYLT